MLVLEINSSAASSFQTCIQISAIIHDATHGSLALKAYQQNLYLKYYY